jgi:hypothetical protein
MVQQSQGYIVDRSAETLTAGDAAVVKFRTMMLREAKALAAGEEPKQPWQSAAFCTRPGSWFAAEDTPLEGVMVERFGDPHGNVGGAGTA